MQTNKLNLLNYVLSITQDVTNEYLYNSQVDILIIASFVYVGVKTHRSEKNIVEFLDKLSDTEIYSR